MASSRGAKVALTLVILLPFLFVGLLWMLIRGGERDGLGKDDVAQVDVVGGIFSSEDLIQRIKRLDGDSSVKAILLHVNSPGGGAAASQEIHDFLLKRKAKGDAKPLVTSIESVGASGAYYVAVATDRVFANRASVVGSIGVIASWVNYGDAMKSLKLGQETIKSGAMKDVGNPSRPMTPEERAFFQQMIGNLYEQFLGDVAQARHMDAEKLRPLADGRVWTGKQAMDLGLIDELGGVDDALSWLEKSKGLRPHLVLPRRPVRGLLGQILGDEESQAFKGLAQGVHELAARSGTPVEFRWEGPR